MADVRQISLWLVIVMIMMGTSDVQSNEISIENSVEKEDIIFPGTNWCGHGNEAVNYEDLGYFRKTDKCCRDHDHCPVYINAGEEKYGYINEMTYAISHCQCDKKFRRCLRKSKSMASDMVGSVYFQAVECFVLNKNEQVKGMRALNY